LQEECNPRSLVGRVVNRSLVTCSYSTKMGEIKEGPHIMKSKDPVKFKGKISP